MSSDFDKLSYTDQKRILEQQIKHLRAGKQLAVLPVSQCADDLLRFCIVSCTNFRELDCKVD